MLVGRRARTTEFESSDPFIPVPDADANPNPDPYPPIPEGTYEADVSRADAIHFHVSAGLIDEQTGHFKLTIRAGRWRLVQTANHAIQNPIEGGIYYGTGHTVVLEWQIPANDTGKDTCRWRFDAKSKMLFITILRAEPDIGSQTDAATALKGDRTVFQSHLWRRTRSTA